VNRETKQREAVLKLVRSMSSHPTADCVYELARLDLPNISKGTVYRNLKVLQELGQITRLDMKSDASRYDGRLDDHYHFRCEKCGEVCDIDMPVDAELDRRMAEATGLEITSHRLEFRGVCADCLAKVERE
jgi:Fur family peroxide stress response transcriptional regulator